MTDDEPTTPDREALRAIAEEIETLNATVARLRELGEEADLPAIERNAKRVEGVASALSDNVPPELLDE